MQESDAMLATVTDTAFTTSGVVQLAQKAGFGATVLPFYRGMPYRVVVVDGGDRALANRIKAFGCNPVPIDAARALSQPQGRAPDPFATSQQDIGAKLSILD